MTGVPRLLARRLAIALVTLIALSILLFLFVSILPGDAASRSLGIDATPSRLAAARAELGLNKPVFTRYWSWVTHALHGDFGRSLISRTPVRDAITSRLEDTLLLAGLVIVTITLLAVLGGLWTGTRPGSRIDNAVMTWAMIINSLPEFVIASVLITIFAWQLHWLSPVVVLEPGHGIIPKPSMLILPVLSVASVSGAFAIRLVRAVVIDASMSSHVESARLQGVPEAAVLLRHLLPGILAPTAQVIAFLIPYLIGGTIVVEAIFNYPGLSQTLLSAVSNRDAPIVEAIGLIMASATVTAMFLSDAIAIISDPKRRGRVV